jgi:hypothetical protein
MIFADEPVRGIRMSATAAERPIISTNKDSAGSNNCFSILIKYAVDCSQVIQLKKLQNKQMTDARME